MDIASGSTSNNSKPEDKNAEAKNLEDMKKQCLVGEIPPGFLSMPNHTDDPLVNGKSSPKATVNSRPPLDAALSPPTSSLYMSRDVQGSSNHVSWADDNEPSSSAMKYMYTDEELEQRRKQEEADRMEAEKLQNEEYRALDAAAKAASAAQPPTGNSPTHLVVLPPSSGATTKPLPTVPQLKITVVQAKLTKGHGFARMDPYANIHVGPKVYTTKPCTNGDKAPRWDETIVCPYRSGIRSIRVEVFDQKTFTTDVLLAWTDVTLTEDVFAGHFQDKWYPLYSPADLAVAASGNVDDLAKEGTINLVISYRKVPAQVPNRVGGRPRSKSPTVFPVPTSSRPQNPVPVTISPTDVKDLCEMFPSVEESTVKLVLEEKAGDKAEAVNALLSMCQDS